MVSVAAACSPQRGAPQHQPLPASLVQVVAHGLHELETLLPAGFAGEHGRSPRSPRHQCSVDAREGGADGLRRTRRRPWLMSRGLGIVRPPRGHCLPRSTHRRTLQSHHRTKAVDKQYSRQKRNRALGDNTVLEKISIDVSRRNWHPSPLAGPIALVTTVDSDRHANVAPKSLINFATVRPLRIVLGCTGCGADLWWQGHPSLSSVGIWPSDYCDGRGSA